MIKKIDVHMTRTSQYGVLHHFTRKLFEAFQRTGIKTELKEGEGMAQLSTPKPDFTIGFNGAPRDKENTLFCDYFKVPHVSLLVDPPYRFFYLTKSPYTIIGCDDRIGCTLLNTIGFEKNFFLPHAVERELGVEPAEKKVFDIVMLATFIDFEKRRMEWKEKYPRSIVKVIDNAIDITFSNKEKSFITAINEAFYLDQKKHLDVPFDGVNLIEVLQDLEMYVKGRERAELASSFSNSTLHIFGGKVDERDWKSYLGNKHPSIYFHGPVNYSLALDIMKKAKVVINPSLKNKEGAHERLFSGLACEALIVSNDNPFLRESFSDEQGIVFYDPMNRKELNATLEEYIHNDEKRKKEVEIGKSIVMKKHTWDNRVEEILKIAPPFIKKMRGL